MRKIIAILGVCVLGAIGCHHVGGKCDCGAQPGDAGVYAPYQTAPIKMGSGTTTLPMTTTAPVPMPSK